MTKGEAMKRGSSGIRIYRMEMEKKPGAGSKTALWFLCLFCVLLLGAAWWNAFLSIFALPADRVWIYVGTAMSVCVIGLADRWLGLKGDAAVFLIAAGAAWMGREIVMTLFGEIAEAYLALASDGTLTGTAALFPGMGNLPRWIPFQKEMVLGLVAGLVMIPILEVWFLVLRTGRGMLLSWMLALAPVIAAAVAGYIPGTIQTWMLLLTGGLYTMIGTAAGKKAGGAEPGKILGTVLSGMAVLGIMALLSSQAGKLLDGGREAEGGFYLNTRAAIHAGLETGAREIFGRGAAAEEEAGSAGEQTEEREEPEALPASENENTEAQEFDSSAITSGNAMEDLKSIGAFSPAPGAKREITFEKRPTETVYLPERIGVTYTGGSWEETSDWEEEPGPEYLEYPPALTRLESLCRDWDTSSADAVTEEIRTALSERAVYDTRPGSTPADEDFAEYFLFENQRGFCVHFATTAVLLYRMCDQPARYAQGYAVPASAFAMDEEGRYTAAVDGTMGHAWVQLYDEDDGGWIDVEHTPPGSAAGEEDDNQGRPADRLVPAEEESGAFAAAVRGIIRAVGILLLLALLMMGQAGIRRGFRKKRKKRNGEGVMQIYSDILRIAGLQGIKTGNGLERRNIEILKKAYPEVPGAEWDRLYEAVLENMFYYPSRKKTKEAEEIYERFVASAVAGMNLWQKLLYRYIYCY